jgi:hypothetical protein
LQTASSDPSVSTLRGKLYERCGAPLHPRTYGAVL